MAQKINKRGSVQDLTYIGVVLLVFSVLILIGYKISSDINTQIQASDEFEAQGKAAFGQINSMYPNVIDNSFLLLSVGLAIAAFVLASLVRIHPVFFVFYFIVLIIIIIISGVFSNIYLEMANVSELSAIADQLTFTTRIMFILPYFVGIFGFLLAIIMYKNYREAQY